MDIIKQCLMSLGTGIVVGGVFAWLKLAPPSPNMIGLFGVIGLTTGYLIVSDFINK